MHENYVFYTYSAYSLTMYISHLLAMSVGKTMSETTHLWMVWSPPMVILLGGYGCHLHSVPGHWANWAPEFSASGSVACEIRAQSSPTRRSLKSCPGAQELVNWELADDGLNMTKPWIKLLTKFAGAHLSSRRMPKYGQIEQEFLIL